jgi:poly-beta-1,6-N-acetyl-D-glucosamine biosynthesis protein PgaD
MCGSLIIDARHRLRWHQRLLSGASTALLWTAWIWLWMPLLRAWSSVVQLGARVAPAVPKVAVLGLDDGLSYSVAAVLGASGTLIAWNKLPARRASVAPVVSLRAHADHFRLAEHELRAGREASVCVVHHDDHGRIVRVERRDARGPVRRSA